jgi:SAM-dependent methyltransferase
MDIGCGYGRLSPLFLEKGWAVLGVDPSLDLLKYAQESNSVATYVVGKLPSLPVAPGAVHFVLMQNLIRVLKLMGEMQALAGVGAYVAPGGRVAVVENIRVGHPNYVEEFELIGLMRAEGLKLVRTLPIRASRWWMVYAIRYGLVPANWLVDIARWELRRMRHRGRRPRLQYYNVLFLFEKPMPPADTR